MPPAAARVLAVLELLQAHGELTGAEIARRLGVDVRTVRRYIGALEDLGVPITAERGRSGGYGLVAGYRLPPMLFNDDEALALAFGLLAARGLGLGRAAPGLASAQAKLERVMPERIRRRLHAASTTMRIDLPETRPERGDAADPRHLADLAEATQEERAVEIAYRAADGSATERRVDPYGLAWRGGSWYVAGQCHLRGGVRHFRVDRIQNLRLLDTRFERPAGFDALAELTAAIATLPRAYSAEIQLDTDVATARRRILATLGRLEPLSPAASGTLLFVETEDLDWLARELARLPFAFTIRRPAALSAALARHAARLAATAKRATLRSGRSPAGRGRRGRGSRP